jgi:long-chain acyl-CoA synthetase
MVQFNPEELEKRLAIYKEDATKAYEHIKKDLLKNANERLNRFSKLSLIIETTTEFEKTATLKIKRYLYK